jgi:ABC-type phosphate/phosphonate transport system substrate-binding protein
MFRILALILACILTTAASAPAQQKKENLYIAVSSALSDHMEKDMVQEGMKSLRTIVETETEHKTEVFLEPDWKQVVADLKAGKRNLAGLAGYELAWARERDPKILPLMIIINEKPRMQSHVLVKKDAAATKLADLAGKSLALSRTSRAHTRLWLDRQFEQIGKPAKVTAPANSEDAIDDVVDGLADAVVVEDVAVEAYRRRKPGRFAQLKDLAQSEPFPPSVVVYYQGGIDDKTLDRFREGMLYLNQAADGQRMLTLWKHTAFLRVPKDYDQALKDIAKLYPEKK